MATPRQNPLGEEHLQTLNQGIAQAEAANAQIELAKQAGIPVDQFEQGAKDTHARLLRMKQTYFPGR